MKTKFFLGPMSKNIVDVILKINNDNNNCVVGLIPSRRQIEYSGGYVNGWTTKKFADYVREKSFFTIIQRDHGGRLQGDKEDDGKISYRKDIDCNFNIIHVDPWKSAIDFKDGCQKTLEDIEYCLEIKQDILFEVGTEESIFSYDEIQLENLLFFLKKNLKEKFKQIQFAVVQGGTKLRDSTNVGKEDNQKLKRMCEVASKYSIGSKEHNGDFLKNSQIYDKFREANLSAINIAPEFGVYETQILLSYMSDIDKEEFYKICFNSGKWKKWVSNNFDISKQEELIKICGHYNFNNPFIENFKEKNNLDSIIKRQLEKTILEKISENNSI